MQFKNAFWILIPRIFTINFIGGYIMRTLIGTWRGVPCFKLPSDLIMLAEVIHRVKPDIIIESGCAQGGSTLFLRDMARLVKPEVVVCTIDLNLPRTLDYQIGIRAFQASSTLEDTVQGVKSQITPQDVVLVDLDSDHDKDHVLREMELYGALVTPGSYLIVEDTNINGNPVLEGFGDGPMEAVREFLPLHPDFQIDKYCEKFGVTFFPSGWLKRS